MSETKSVTDVEEFEIEEEGFDLEEDLFPEVLEEEILGEEILEEEVQAEQEGEEIFEDRTRKESKHDSDKQTFKLDEDALAEIKVGQDPSYTNVKFPYYLICEKRLAERMKQVRMLLKSEVEKITAEQTSAFESVRIRRLYKTGMGLPERIFVEHEKGYTFKERERLRYLMNHEII